MHPAGWRKGAAGILDGMLSSDDAWPFAEPVPRDTEFYYDVITHPTDLGTIRKRLHSGDFCDASRVFLAVQQVGAAHEWTRRLGSLEPGCNSTSL